MSADDGRKEVRENRSSLLLSGGLGPFRGREAPCAPMYRLLCGAAPGKQPTANENRGHPPRCATCRARRVMYLLGSSGATHPTREMPWPTTHRMLWNAG